MITPNEGPIRLNLKGINGFVANSQVRDVVNVSLTTKRSVFSWAVIVNAIKVIFFGIGRILVNIYCVLITWCGVVNSNSITATKPVSPLTD